MSTRNTVFGLPTLAPFFVALVAVASLAMPTKADALLRIGGDVRWVPLAVESPDSDPMALNAGRQLESLGVGARFLIGFDYFSIGPKLNFTRHVYADPALSFSQFDANAHVRMRIPTARLAIFAEGGPAVALDIGGLGYTTAFGVEVDVLGWPLIDMNLGLAVQYASVPVGIGPNEVRMNEGVRGMVVIGFDFTLQP